MKTHWIGAHMQPHGMLHTNIPFPPQSVQFMCRIQFSQFTKTMQSLQLVQPHRIIMYGAHALVHMTPFDLILFACWLLNRVALSDFTDKTGQGA